MCANDEKYQLTKLGCLLSGCANMCRSRGNVLRNTPVYNGNTIRYVENYRLFLSNSAGFNCDVILLP